MLSRSCCVLLSWARRRFPLFTMMRRRTPPLFSPTGKWFFSFTIPGLLSSKKRTTPIFLQTTSAIFSPSHHLSPLLRPPFPPEDQFQLATSTILSQTTPASRCSFPLAHFVFFEHAYPHSSPEGYLSFRLGVSRFCLVVFGPSKPSMSFP